MIRLHLKSQMRTPQGRESLEIDLTVGKGEMVALFGNSGAGKTTILRMLAGLTRPQEGHIEVDGEIWFDSHKKINRPIQQRRTGFVFQDNTLFPNMTVQENLEFACHKQERGAIGEWISLVGLKGLESQKPHQLSGGQRQRAALVRAMVCRPKILLLDEPLSDLDIPARLNLQEEIIKIYQKTGLTTILVSHDLPEVFRMSKRIFIVDRGKITAFGSPQEVFVKSDLSGKFKFAGQIMEIHKDGVLNILTIAIGNQLAKAVASDEEITGLTIGSRIIVAAKAFNPLIIKS